MSIAELSPADRVRLSVRAARASPAGLATVASRGRWKAARHHLLMEEKLLEALDVGGRLIISVTVRSGKSEFFARWVPAWYIGTHPESRVIIGSHEKDFAASHGRFARDVLTEWGPTLYGVDVDQKSSAAFRWDLAGHHGGLFAVGVGGAPIGRGADLMVIDDPIPNFETAMSPTFRKHIHEWWAGTLRSRLQPGATVVVISSRWHEDDLSGWLMKEYPDDWTELRLPALADDENDPLGRELGEALWPEAGWNEEEYERARREVTAAFGTIVWDAQYQNKPSAEDGDMFPRAKWRYCDPSDVPASVRWWRGYDLAATQGGGDWTVGVKLGVHPPTGQWYIADVVRVQLGPGAMEAKLEEIAHADGAEVSIWLPQDPGQAGKAQAASFKKLLAGYRVETAVNTGDKETRAWPLAAQVKSNDESQPGNVVLVRGSWNREFVDELAKFPRGAHDDQVDAAASGFNAASAAAKGRGGLRG